MSKYIRIIISMCIIICLISICLLIYLLSKNQNEPGAVDKSTNEVSIYNKENSYKEDQNNSFEYLRNTNDYIKVKRILNTYFNYIRQLNGDIKIDTNMIEESKEDTINRLQTDSINYLNNVLDKDYIKLFCKNNSMISVLANTYKKNTSLGMYTDDIDYNVFITQIYSFNMSDNIQILLISYSVNNNENQMLIKFDLLNNTFSIFLEEYITKYNINKDNNLNDLDISLNEEISLNNNNSIIKVNATDETMAREYLNIQKYNLLNDYEKEYSLLNTDYKQKRFPTIEMFKEYISNIQASLSNIKLSKYSVDNKDNKVIYNLVDNYGRYYIIEVGDGVLDYTVKLDDYTILTDEYRELYNQADDKDKVLTNVQLFIKMINNKDYTTAYNLLDETFKANNFPTEDDFKNYIKKNFYSYSEIVSSDEISNEGTYYISTFTIKSLVNASSKEVQRTLIIALGEGTDFKMSLSV